MISSVLSTPQGIRKEIGDPVTRGTNLADQAANPKAEPVLASTFPDPVDSRLPADPKNIAEDFQRIKKLPMT